MGWDTAFLIGLIAAYAWKIARTYVDVGDYIKLVVKYKETKLKNIEDDMKKAMKKLGKVFK